MSAFSNTNIWDAVIEVLTPIVPTYKEYAVQVLLPFARIEEGQTMRTYFTLGADANQYAVIEGQFFIHVQSSTLDLTRQLMDQIVLTMNSLRTRITYASGRLMMMEPLSPVFHPEIQSAPDSPSVFPATITIHYVEQRTV